jgi:hypothetical protein
MNEIWFGIPVIIFGLLIVSMHRLFTRGEAERHRERESGKRYPSYDWFPAP